MMSRLFALALTIFATASFESHAAQALIQYVNCGSVDSRAGTTTVTYTGSVGGEIYFNVTNINPLGFPFTQQARLVNTRLVENGLEFELRAMVTGATAYLTLKNGTSEGLLATSRGDDQDGIRLTCSSRVSGL